MDNLTAKLYQFPKTVLTTRDLAILWQETNHNNLKSKIAYYVKQGVLTRLTRGVFTKEKIYDAKELAGSLYTPSYISFETVLREAGIIFQHYDTLFAAAPWSRTITIDAHTMTFRKLKDTVLYNPSGVTHTGRYSIATPERAFLDMIYLFPTYYFDHLQSLNWEKCFELVRIYDNRQLEMRLEKYSLSYVQ
jgi:predicted transcriptional regulator of viral defense system